MMMVKFFMTKKPNIYLIERIKTYLLKSRKCGDFCLCECFLHNCLVRMHAQIPLFVPPLQQIPYPQGSPGVQIPAAGAPPMFQSNPAAHFIGLPQTHVMSPQFSPPPVLNQPIQETLYLKRRQKLSFLRIFYKFIPNSRAARTALPRFFRV